MSIIAEVNKTSKYLTIPVKVQEYLSINEFSEIEFLIEEEGVLIQVFNPPTIEVGKKQLTIIRNDFICQNSNCDNPILKNRGKRKYCCRKCLFEHRRITKD